MTTYHPVNKVLFELYRFIDDAFIDYFISLPAPEFWRSQVERYEQELGNLFRSNGVSEVDIKCRIDQQSKMFVEGEFKVQTTIANLKANLEPGRWENIQAQRAIKTIYDDWDSQYRVELKKIIGHTVKGDIWGDLRFIRQSLTHRCAIGINDLSKTKLIKDFLPDQPIIFTPAIMKKIQQELENWYTEFQIKYFSL